MTNSEPLSPPRYHQRFYQISVSGQLEPAWYEWFEGLNITQEENGNSLLFGPIVDQAALFGVLLRIQSLGLPLLSVIPVGPVLPGASFKE